MNHDPKITDVRLIPVDGAADLTVLVAGATGTVGREVVRGLLERGARVRALTRHPAGAEIDPRAEPVRGDLTDAASLTAALEGVDAVHLISFDAERGAGGGDALQNPEEVLAALRSAGLRRVTGGAPWCTRPTSATWPRSHSPSPGTVAGPIRSPGRS